MSRQCPKCQQGVLEKLNSEDLLKAGKKPDEVLWGCDECLYMEDIAGYEKQIDKVEIKKRLFKQLLGAMISIEYSRLEKEEIVGIVERAMTSFQNL